MPGVIAANTTLPVIGVPVKGSVLDGVDALYSIIQMPPGIPVATVAINGAMNAAILAVQMLALADETLATKFADYIVSLKNKIVKANEELKEVKYTYKTNKWITSTIHEDSLMKYMLAPLLWVALTLYASKV